MTAALVILATWFALGCAVTPALGRVLARRSAELEELS